METILAHWVICELHDVLIADVMRIPPGPTQLEYALEYAMQQRTPVAIRITHLYIVV